MGLTRQDIIDSCAFFREHGGYCDCEIILNIQRPDALVAQVAAQL
jgi:hypothetical protein